jgi:hypothetical protein
MFTLSVGKILLIVLVAVVAWRGLRLWNEVQARLAQRSGPPPAAPGARTAAASSRATELVECPRCGIFVPNGTICRSVEECRFRRRS